MTKDCQTTVFLQHSIDITQKVYWHVCIYKGVLIWAWSTPVTPLAHSTSTIRVLVQSKKYANTQWQHSNNNISTLIMSDNRGIAGNKIVVRTCVEAPGGGSWKYVGVFVDAMVNINIYTHISCFLFCLFNSLKRATFFPIMCVSLDGSLVIRVRTQSTYQLLYEAPHVSLPSPLSTGLDRPVS